MLYLNYTYIHHVIAAVVVAVVWVLVLFLIDVGFSLIQTQKSDKAENPAQGIESKEKKKKTINERWLERT